MAFDNFSLSEAVVHGVQRMGYLEPTPIQAAAIPIIEAGSDLVASAETGSGKTAAFALPILSKLTKEQRKGMCLILEPTRELAKQVDDSFREFSYFTYTSIALIHGGVGYDKQRQKLDAGAEVVIATPGRLLDLAAEGVADLSRVSILVLDEVDRMLDMGFLPDVRRIIEQCPSERQTLFFSATMPEEIERLSKWCLSNPQQIEIGAKRAPAATVTHALFPVARDQKFDLLVALLEQCNYKSVLIFTRTKDGADRVANRLQTLDHSVTVLHSNRSQRERTEALEGFRSGRFEILVATDIAARGLDIAGVTHVINFDVPQNAEDYVHRIGRTGRAQQEGDAYTIVTAEELPFVQDIERFINQSIERRKLPGFSYLFTALFNEDRVTSVLKNSRGVRTSKGYHFGATRKRK